MNQKLLLHVDVCKIYCSMFLLMYQNKPCAVLRFNHIPLKRGEGTTNKMKHIQTHSTVKVSQQNTDKIHFD